MSKQYAEFRIGDLFEANIKRGDISSQGNLVDNPNGVSFVAQNDGNNGFVKSIEQGDHKIFSSGSICIGRQTGIVYYQPYDFATTDGVLVIEIEKNRKIGMYIASSLSKALTGSGYTNTVSAKSLNNTFITLPIIDASADTDSPEPDWEYMENYIKEIEEKYLDSVEKYNRINEDILDALHPDYHGEEPEAYDYAEFKVGELFEVNNLAYFDIKDVSEGEGKPLVSTRTTQNGYQFFSSEEEKKIHKGNVITLSAHSAQFFYQPIDFISVSHMYSISHEKINRKIGMYLVSAFSKLTSKQFNFSQKLTGKRFSDMSVSLPVTSDGDPDWLFMEEYINFIEGGGEEKSQTTCSTRGEHLETTHSEALEEPTLKEFKIGELFKYDNGSRLNTALRVKGKKPFLTAGFENRGLYGYVGNDITIFHDPITIDMFGNCFYHSYDCGGDDNVYFLEGDYSARQKLYIASVLHKNLSPIYSYAKQFRKKQLDELTITLPSTPSGEPDWEYMENYIKMIEDQKKMKIKNYVEYKVRT